MTYSVVYTVRLPSNDGSGIDDICGFDRQFTDINAAKRFAAKFARRHNPAMLFIENSDGTATRIQ